MQRTTPHTELRLQIRKNVADSSVEAGPADRTHGRALLSPALANVGLIFRGFFWLGVHVFYESPKTYEEARDEAAAKKVRLTFNEFCTGKAEDFAADCHTRFSHGFYAVADVAQSKFTTMNAGEGNADGNATAPQASGFAVPSKFSGGYALSLEGILPQALSGSRAVRITPYTGGTVRMVGGEISAADRKRIFGNASFAYLGGELGVELQLSNVILSTELTVIAPGASIENRAPGLSGLQFGSTLTFLLPWTVAGDTKADTNAPKPANTNSGLQKLRTESNTQ